MADKPRISPQELQQRLTDCQWPLLADPYNNALHQAVVFILGYVPDLLGIVVSGTIVRGTPSASSDLDIYVLRRNLERQRIQRWFNGVPAEIFINPPQQARRYIVQERRTFRPITAHMLDTGFTVYAKGPIVANLRAMAKEACSSPPDITKQQLTSARYMAAARLEDALDIVATRPETARMILSLAVYDMLHYRFLQANRFFPRDKDLLDLLAVLDAPLAELAKAFVGSPSLDSAVTLAKHIADHTIRTYGFFEWSSHPETIAAADEQRTADRSQAQRKTE